MYVSAAAAYESSWAANSAPATGMWQDAFYRDEVLIKAPLTEHRGAQESDLSAHSWDPLHKGRWQVGEWQAVGEVIRAVLGARPFLADAARSPASVRDRTRPPARASGVPNASFFAQI